MYLSNLGIALLARFERTGDQADLDAAVGNLRAAVAATPAGHPNRAAYLSNLGNALQTRFEADRGPSRPGRSDRQPPGCVSRHPGRPAQTKLTGCPTWATLCGRGLSGRGIRPT